MWTFIKSDDFRSPSPIRSTSPTRRGPFGRSKTPNRDEFDSPVKDSSISPRRSPNKSDAAGEIDPELVRVALRDFAQKLRDFERERDEAYAQVSSLQRQLSEMESDRNDCEQRLQTLQKTLEESENGMYWFKALAFKCLLWNLLYEYFCFWNAFSWKFLTRDD